MQVRKKRLIQAAAGVLLAAVFLTMSVWKLDARQFWEHLRAIDAWSLPPLLILYAAFFWLRALRWRLFLAPLRPLETREVFPALMIGYMANNLLPAHLGEFVRMFVLARQFGLKNTAVLSTIVLERVFDMLAIVALFAATLHLIPASGQDSRIRLAGLVLGLLCVAMLLVMLVFVRRAAWALKTMERCLRPLPAGIREKALTMAAVTTHGLLSLRKPSLLAGTVLTSLVIWGTNAIACYLTAAAVPHDNPVPLSAGFLLMVTIAFAIALPTAPGFVGTTQYCYVVALGVFGVPQGAALAASFYGTFISYVPVTLVGLFFLARLGMRLGTIREGAEHAGEETAHPALDLPEVALALHAPSQELPDPKSPQSR